MANTDKRDQDKQLSGWSTSTAMWRTFASIGGSERVVIYVSIYEATEAISSKSK